MNTLKKSLAVLVAFGFLLAVSSCNRHTCPTYSKADIQQTQSNA